MCTIHANSAHDAVTKLCTLPLLAGYWSFGQFWGFWVILVLEFQRHHGLSDSRLGLLYSLPFAVQPLQHAFEAVGRRPLEAAATLRASPLDTFFHVTLPLARAGIVQAAVLSFAHTVGEFGVVLMIGGNIPQQTRVVSTQIYGHVEALDYTQAHWLAAGMVAFSFLVLLALYALNPTGRRR